MIITFIGHSFVFSQREIKDIIMDELRNIISDTHDLTCYIGGRGDFDNICADVCRDLKKEFNSINVYYITPYLSLSEQKKIKEMQSAGLCDESIYPPIEKTPPKFAISKRNEWMISNSDLIIVYINHNYGGAYKSFTFAQRKKKKIINICDL